jgi:prepilin-type N-terminal cleavage/methylation domain-containing protein
MSIARLRDRSAGFSLLEVMMSLAILGMSLVIVSRIVTGNVRATHHSRMTTAATFLARTRISMMEQSLQEYGFGELDGEDTGDFSQEGFAAFSWYTNVERIELPADSTQKVQQASSQKSMSNNPMEMLSGFMGGFMSTLMEPIRLGLQESVRKLTVRVKWMEAGKPQQSIEVVNFLTDPSRLEMAVSMSANAGTGGTGGSGTGGKSGSGGSGGSKK